MMETLRRNRKADGEAFRPDVFTEIAGLDLAVVGDLDRRDIGPDRADVIGDGCGQQRAGIIGGADDRSIRKFGGPALLRGAINHGTIPGPVGGHHRRARDLDFLLFERRGHSAASSRLQITWLSWYWRHGAECATTSPMTRSAGPPSMRPTRSGRSASVPTTACASGRVTRANTPTGVRGERPAASMPSRIDGAAVMPM